jgi:LacI family transcriptional regulator, galactose operon repressor
VEAQYRVPPDLGLEIDGTVMDWQEGHRTMTQRLAAGPRDFTAVFALNDLQPSLDLDLTTVHLPHEEIGRTAVRLALDHENQGDTPPHVVLGTHVVVRGSVRSLGGVVVDRT